MSDFTKTIHFIKELYSGKDFIPLHEPKFIGNEKLYVNDAIDSTFVSSVGQYVNRFEEDIAKVAGTKYAVATVNGTAALHIALQIAGVKQNELVICQALTFVATCNAISYLGAEPVFIDVDADTLGMSAQSLEKWLENNTYQKIDEERGSITVFHQQTHQRIAAIVPMHTFGNPCRIESLDFIASKYNLPLIEDAAESLGSYYNNKHTGSFGLMGTFSFNGNKTITCGGGGAIVTNDKNLAQLAKHLTTQAKVPHAWEFNHDMIGYNYRMPNLNAALACAQLENLSSFVANKRKTAKLYLEFFETINSIKFISETNDGQSNYWLNAIMLENRDARDEFLKQSNAQGVMTRPVWNLMHQLPMFKNCLRDDLSNSLFLADRIVNIPSSVNFSEENN